MISEKTETNSSYIIISGLFKYNISEINRTELWQEYFHWQNRINGGKYKASFDYFNSSYYDGYLNNIFPEIRHDKSDRNNINPNYLNHLTNKEYINNTINADLIINAENSIKCILDFADIYLFPNKIGVFTIKFSLSKSLDLGSISDFINKIRQLNSILKINDTETSLNNFIDKNILSPLNIKEDWSVYNPQLKTYNILDLKEKISDKEMDYLLYDIANVTPIGSGEGKGMFAPSDTYLKEQITNNKISVFKNWSAIALFDTFTRISINFPDTFNSWELDYFHVYIHTLHVKFFMYMTNSHISDVTVVTKETEMLRDSFVEFVNDYYQTHISYKFLPDLIQDKLLYALEINSEIKTMETKIKRINEYAQEKREQRMNLVLLVITFLSVFSVIYDLSNWIINAGVSKNIVFPWISIILGLIVFITIIAIFKFPKKNK